MKYYGFAMHPIPALADRYLCQTPAVFGRRLCRRFRDDGGGSADSLRVQCTGGVWRAGTQQARSVLSQFMQALDVISGGAVYASLRPFLRNFRHAQRAHSAAPEHVNHKRSQVSEKFYSLQRALSTFHAIMSRHSCASAQNKIEGQLVGRRVTEERATPAL